MVALVGEKSAGRIALWIVVALFVLGLGLFIYGMYHIEPIAISMAEARARQLAVEAINRAVSEVMTTGIGYSELVKVGVGADGHVSMIQANTLLMNDLASQAALVAQRNLQLLGDEGVELPLGSALGISLFAGLGPELHFSVVPVGSVTTRFVTAFESAGINQTRHEISLLASILMRIIIPTGAETISVELSVPVAESIIVGEVPDTYLNVPNTGSILNMIP